MKAQFYSIENGFKIQANHESKTMYDIFMYGIVGHHINIDNFMAEIEDLPDSVTDINFYFNSPGGMVFEGFSLLTNMSRLRNRYNTVGYIDGVAASMMSAIALNVDKTIASPTSSMMIHDPSAGIDIFGQYNRKKIQEMIKTLEGIGKNLETMTDIFAFPFAQKTGMTIMDVKNQWMDGDDHWLKPEEMLQAGLIDEISVGEFVKPEGFSKEDEDDWFLANMSGIAARYEKDGKDSYRGVHEKVFASLAINGNNSDNKYRNRPGLSDTGKQTTKKDNKMSEFAPIAKKLNLDENTGLPGITSALDTKLSRLSKVEGDLKDLQATIEQYKQTNTDNENTIKDLKSKLMNTRVGEVVATATEKAVDGSTGKEVNKNIQDDLKAVAKRYLRAEAEEDEEMTATLMDAMVLKAKSNLVPIGKNKDLNSDATDRDDPNPGAVDSERVKAARERGEAKAKKRKQQWEARAAQL